MKRIKKKATFENLEEVLQFVKVGAKAFGFDKAAIADLILAVEEVLVNIISYAYTDQCKSGYMEVRYKNNNSSYSITFLDTGKKFDPTAVSEPDTSIPINQRRMGGMGIHIVRNIVDNLQYKREGGKNIFTIEKKK
ncbi:MAG: ATP-binding protein [Victivallales bacterium]|nr:ATP-binding protein [Victivallales bacterium]MCF7889080.1 ATP-binding protein [Victivallales bacterium]